MNFVTATTFVYTMCNFVNMYMIAYHVHNYTYASLIHSSNPNPSLSNRIFPKINSCIQKKLINLHSQHTVLHLHFQRDSKLRFIWICKQWLATVTARHSGGPPFRGSTRVRVRVRHESRNGGPPEWRTRILATTATKQYCQFWLYFILKPTDFLSTNPLIQMSYTKWSVGHISKCAKIANRYGACSRRAVSCRTLVQIPHEKWQIWQGYMPTHCQCHIAPDEFSNYLQQ